MHDAARSQEDANNRIGCRTSHGGVTEQPRIAPIVQKVGKAPESDGRCAEVDESQASTLDKWKAPRRPSLAGELDIKNHQRTEWD